MGKDLATGVSVLLITGWILASFLYVGEPRNPLARTEITAAASEGAKSSVPTTTTSKDRKSDPAFEEHEPGYLPSAELLANIKNFVDTPKTGIDWKLFGQTKERPYSYSDKDGTKWMGVRPEFSAELKKHDGKEILVKGFMFPLGQQEKQPHFLLGPFPVSCPFHYDVTPGLIIEVHAEKPIAFSYDAVAIRGKLELIPQDDEYNVFYRLKKAKRVDE